MDRECRVCKQVKPIAEFREFIKSGRLYRRHECQLCGNAQFAGARKRARDERRRLKESGEWDRTLHRCSSCCEEKPAAEFPGTDLRCRLCSRKRARTARAAGRGRFSSVASIARRRGIQFTLTADEYTGLIARPCMYCGGSLPKWGMGIDRKINALGYTPENSVPSCEHCNRTKADVFTFEEMILIGATIRQVRERRAQNGEADLSSATGRKQIGDHEFYPRLA